MSGDRFNRGLGPEDGSPDPARSRFGARKSVDMDSLAAALQADFEAAEQRQQDQALVSAVSHSLNRRGQGELVAVLADTFDTLQRRELTVSERKLLRLLCDTEDKLRVTFSAEQVAGDRSTYSHSSGIQLFGMRQIQSASDGRTRDIKLSPRDIYCQLLGALAYASEDLQQRQRPVIAPGSIEGSTGSLVVSMRLHFLAAAAAVNTCLLLPSERETFLGVLSPILHQFRAELQTLGDLYPGFRGLRDSAQRFAFLHLLVREFPEVAVGDSSAVNTSSPQYQRVLSSARQAKFR